MRFKSADDGISTAVVLCLQSGKARGQTPQQRGAYLLRRRCKDVGFDCWLRMPLLVCAELSSQYALE